MHACTRGLSFISSLTTKDASYTGNVKFELENGMPVVSVLQTVLLVPATQLARMFLLVLHWRLLVLPLMKMG